jgi:hypothetical protein
VKELRWPKGKFVSYLAGFHGPPGPFRPRSRGSAQGGRGLPERRQLAACKGKFVEVESGKKADRPQLEKAFQLCRILSAPSWSLPNSTGCLHLGCCFQCGNHQYASATAPITAHTIQCGASFFCSARFSFHSLRISLARSSLPSSSAISCRMREETASSCFPSRSSRHANHDKAKAAPATSKYVHSGTLLIVRHGSWCQPARRIRPFSPPSGVECLPKTKMRTASLRTIERMRRFYTIPSSPSLQACANARGRPPHPWSVISSGALCLSCARYGP